MLRVLSHVNTLTRHLSERGTLLSKSADEEIVAHFLAAVADLSTHAAGAQISGVTQKDVSRWRRGEWERLSTRKRAALTAYLERIRNGRADEETPEQAAAISPLDEWVREFERRVRYGVGKIPGISEYEKRARMSDAIEAQIQALQMVGDPVPERLYELREELRRGEL